MDKTCKFFFHLAKLKKNMRLLLLGWVEMKPAATALQSWIRPYVPLFQDIIFKYFAIQLQRHFQPPSFASICQLMLLGLVHAMGCLLWRSGSSSIGQIILIPDFISNMPQKKKYDYPQNRYTFQKANTVASFTLVCEDSSSVAKTRLFFEKQNFLKLANHASMWRRQDALGSRFGLPPIKTNKQLMRDNSQYREKKQVQAVNEFWRSARHELERKHSKCTWGFYTVAFIRTQI